ncbi:MAG: hypothetical protein CM1200mP15_18140 [Dehalococcoidia bacterium]|nr:MAG: hypothetical protein CM1200mP15_18140 [Dehalococcoidia bacterium]
MCSFNQGNWGSPGVIRNGLADVVFAGGSEAGISELGLSGFSVMRALTTQNEIQLLRVDPLTLIGMDLYPGEGSGILVWKILIMLSLARLKFPGEVVGFGCTADAGHLFSQNLQDRVPLTAIQIALADAKLQPLKWTILMLMEHRLH